MSLPLPNITMNRNRARPFYTGFRTPPGFASILVWPDEVEGPVDDARSRYDVVDLSGDPFILACAAGDGSVNLFRHPIGHLGLDLASREHKRAIGTVSPAP